MSINLNRNNINAKGTNTLFNIVATTLLIGTGCFFETNKDSIFHHKKPPTTQAAKRPVIKLLSYKK